MKRATVESAREVCGSVRVGAARKEVLTASNMEAKERCIELYREEKRKIKRCIYHSIKKVNEQFWKEDE